MRVLLFGGAGYIGTHVALGFLQHGDTVGIFDDLSTGLRTNIHPEATFYEGSILDRPRVSEVLALGWDAVVHLAAFKAAGESMIAPEKYAENNITGSLHLITECCAHQVKKFILSSSAAVYGEPVYLPIDEDHPCHPENYYGYTKLAIEQNLEWFSRLKGLEYVSLRYFNAAGYDPNSLMTGLERNPANLIPVVMEAAIGKRPNILIFGSDYPTSDGTGVRDYVHVTDLADAHVKAADYLMSKKGNLIVNLGSEHGLSVLQIIEAARKITGRPIPSEIVARRPGDPAKLVASSKKAKATLNWSPRFSSLESIIETTWKVYHSSVLKSGRVL
ncbi:MAG: UDP-glucose 4-epimerase GalE [Sphaerochaetaceae bacterium]|jgi:UDP-glucose 4-epimerase|nr:UDP-glucose 4-epimerase GalE [Sphaerochaetaceae bacterium]MDX9809464.1 UDP-glucose 4-epimerase GalE [Sphaerochaetaceae bacterium]